MLFAQETMGPPATIIGAFIVVALALVTLVGWMMKHVFTKTIPQMVKDQKEERETYKAESAAERALCKEQFALVNASIAALATAIQQNNPLLVAEINRHTSEAMAAYRHDMMGTIQEAVLGRELYLAKKRQEQEAELQQRPKLELG